ncbi:hypothetical protein M2155_002084 [Streptomyces sp. SAI-119]|nr:hypothetical protein [Streptomyces sp. SAI-119]
MAGHAGRLLLRCGLRWLRCGTAALAPCAAGAGRADDLGRLLTPLVCRQEPDLVDDQRQEFQDLGPAPRRGGADLGVVWQSVDEGDQPSDSEESGLSWSEPDASGVDPVVSGEVGFDVCESFAEESADRKSFPSSTP